jgi:hypothetical protein
MSLSDGFVQGLSTPVPVAGAGLPIDMTPYAGGPLDPLKEHEAKYKQLERMQRMADRQSAKMLAEAQEAEYKYYGDREEDDLDKVSFVSNHPLLRRQYLLKMAQTPATPAAPTSTPMDPEIRDTSLEGGLSSYNTNTFSGENRPVRDQINTQRRVSDPNQYEFEMEQGDPYEVKDEQGNVTSSGYQQNPTGVVRSSTYDPKSTSNAYRRAQGLRDTYQAYNKQKTFDPSSPMPGTPEAEPSFWDRTKELAGDVGDSLKGMGSRVVRQGTRGLQQAANYGMRNSEFLAGLVDDDEEAKILSSLAASSSGPDRTQYLNQLQQLRDAKGDARAVTDPNNNSSTNFTYRPEGRTLAQQQAIARLSGGDPSANSQSDLTSYTPEMYQALRQSHMEDQARNKGYRFTPGNLTGNNLQEMQGQYGQAFDMYYGRGDEAKRLGINELKDDGFGQMYSDTKDRFNAYRRAKGQLPKDQQALTDPKALQPVESVIPQGGDLSANTRSFVNDHFPGLDYSDPQAFGQAMQGAFEEGDANAFKALEYIGRDVGPQHMTRLLMTSMPDTLQMGKDLNNMSDEEAIAFIQNMPAEKQEQLDSFINLTSKYVAPKLEGAEGGFGQGNLTQEQKDKGLQQVNSSGEGDWYPVPGSDESSFGIGGTLYFNPETGEFNREWGPGNYYRDYNRELPPRYQEALHKALQRDSKSILPNPGMYF